MSIIIQTSLSFFGSVKVRCVLCCKEVEICQCCLGEIEETKPVIIEGAKHAISHSVDYITCARGSWVLLTQAWWLEVQVHYMLVFSYD